MTSFFKSLNYPLPMSNALLMSGLISCGGTLLIVGLGSRFVGFLLADNMFVAYRRADPEALGSILSDFGKCYVAHSFTSIFAPLVVLIFGVGFLSLDYIIAKSLEVQA